jgi:hypothetical protein
VAAALPSHGARWCGAAIARRTLVRRHVTGMNCRLAVAFFTRSSSVSGAKNDFSHTRGRR